MIDIQDGRADGPPPAATHQITRIRRETRRRTATVAAREALSPRMTRITFASPDLADFDSAAHDDHVKLFFPTDAGPAAPAARDFTPRWFDPARAALAIDFVLHEDGPATRWARAAQPGDSLTIGGPRGSTVVADDFDWYLLVGDETALPAIGRRVEELRASARVTTVVTVHDAADHQSLVTAADWRPHWVDRGAADADEAAALIAALERLDPGPGDGFVWIAAETTVARALRRYIVEDRRHPSAWVKAAAYWTRGRAGEHERIGD